MKKAVYARAIMVAVFARAIMAAVYARVIIGRLDSLAASSGHQGQVAGPVLISPGTNPQPG